MQPEFWHERWLRGEIGFHQTDFNVDLLTHWPTLGASNDAEVFVPMCGKSRDMCWLRSRGHRIRGVELSPVAIASFFAEQELIPARHSLGPFECWRANEFTLLAGDFFDLSPDALASCSAVYDRASLIALPPPLRERYAAHLRHILPADARVLLITIEYPHEQMAGPPFSVSEAEVRRLYDGRFNVEVAGTRDTLADEPRLQKRGLTQLVERTYRLRPR